MKKVQKFSINWLALAFVAYAFTFDLIQPPECQLSLPSQLPHPPLCSQQTSPSLTSSCTLGFDDCDDVAALLLRHFRSRLPSSVVDAIWLHLLHDFCPLIDDRRLVIHIKKIFQPPIRCRQLKQRRWKEDVQVEGEGEESASPRILCRFFTAGDEFAEVPETLEGL